MGPSWSLLLLRGSAVVWVFGSAFPSLGPGRPVGAAHFLWGGGDEVTLQAPVLCDWSGEGAICTG